MRRMVVVVGYATLLVLFGVKVWVHGFFCFFFFSFFFFFFFFFTSL